MSFNIISIKNVIETSNDLIILEEFDYNGKSFNQVQKVILEIIYETEILFLSRIICIADSYHAMISNRSYRQALGHEYAVSQLQKYTGTQFDPEIVDAFMKITKEN